MKKAIKQTLTQKQKASNRESQKIEQSRTRLWLCKQFNV
jgi:hypothetical protein